MEKTSKCEALSSAILTKHYSGDQTVRNKMGKEYGIYEEEERCTKEFDGENWRKELTW